MLKKCHFIGIGGAGMSGLARLMLKKNSVVSGSDIATNAAIENLIADGAKVHIGHSDSYIMKDMTVVFSTDIKKDNPEYQAALTHKCKVLHRSELLQMIMANYQSLVVAGTHGKTTTSSLLTWVLENSGLAPSYAIGGTAPQLASNAGQGSGPYFVAEGCESDGSFVNYTPYGAIVTNIDFDHMDHFGTEESLIAAFKRFISNVSSHEHLLWCGDDTHLAKLNPQGISYGFGSDCKLRAESFRQHHWSCCFDISFEGKIYPHVELALTGKHNALNALAVFGLALKLGIDEQPIRAAFKTFGGVLRRCEKKGESHGILFIDDYAHHPTELKATLKAIRSAVGERRLVVVYQPHRYTRAQECMGKYRGIFEAADEVFVTEIYSARERPIPGVTHEKIIEEIQQDHKQHCRYLERKQAADTLAAFLRPHDVLVTLGAGDVTQISAEVQAQFKLKPPTKLKVGLICGGMSVEHEVSLISADYIRSALSSEYYEIENFAISYQGQWVWGPDASKTVKTTTMQPGQLKINPDILTVIMACDIVFPMMHGTLGEDGTMQGFLEILGKAYVGCDHRSAAISMDKVATKKLVQAAGIAVVPYVAFTKHQWRTDREAVLADIKAELRYPLFVKPIHLGSSIGVHKVDDDTQLVAAIENSLRLDSKLIIENGIEMRELEFALLGNDEVQTFPPAEVVMQGQMQGYHEKYGFNGAQPVKAVPKADISSELAAEGMELVKHAYRAVGCTGMARIDTFLDKQGKFWLNEINPIPGCTQHSIYPLICAANGVTPAALVDRLIILGLQRRREVERLEYQP